MISFVSRLFKRAGELAGHSGGQLRDATLLITHAEVSVRHGTGALLKNIFRDEKEIVIFHSQRYAASVQLMDQRIICRKGLEK